MYQGNNYTSYTNYKNGPIRVYFSGENHPAGLHSEFDKISLLLFNRILLGVMFYKCNEQLSAMLKSPKPSKKRNLETYELDRLNFIKNHYGNTCEIMSVKEMQNLSQSYRFEKHRLRVCLDRQSGDPNSLEYELEIEVNPDEVDFRTKYSTAKLVSIKITNLAL